MGCGAINVSGVTTSTSTANTSKTDAAVVLIGGLGLAGSIFCGGNVNQESDESLKKDIEPIANALDKIELLNGVSYNWKDESKNSDKKNIGLIAQNVEKSIPELVTTDNETQIKSVNYAQLVAVLVEAMKEQQKTIKSLQDDVNDFKVTIAEAEVIKQKLSDLDLI